MGKILFGDAEIDIEAHHAVFGPREDVVHHLAVDLALLDVATVMSNAFFVFLDSG